MHTPRSVPRSLKFVAWAFLALGALAVLEMLFLLSRGGLVFNFGVLGLWIGPGLLRLRPSAHKWAVVFAWIGIGAELLAVLLLLAAPDTLDGRLLGLAVAKVSRNWAFGLVALACALSVWQLRVLRRRDVRELFAPRTA